MAESGNNNKNNFLILPNVMSQHIHFKSKKFTKKRVFIIFKYPQRVIVQGKLYFKKKKNKKNPDRLIWK